MNKSILFRNWWVILIQGILMIALSIFILNNPGAVLATLALWFGIIVLATGLYGVIAYFATAKGDRSNISILWSIALSILGFMLLTKMFISMIAISIAFGLLVSVIGLVLISGSWNTKKLSSLWWVIALIGVIIFFTGLKSMLYVEAGAQSISSLIAFSILLSGIGLIWLALLKRKIVNAVTKKSN